MLKSNQSVTKIFLKKQILTKIYNKKCRSIFIMYNPIININPDNTKYKIQNTNVNLLGHLQIYCKTITLNCHKSYLTLVFSK